MEQQNPTAGNGGASTPDPIASLESILDAQDGGTNGQADGAQASDAATNASSNPDKPESDDQAKDGEPQFTTAHLAAYLGIEESDIDVDEDGQPVFKTKVDGKESAAKFADLRKTHQLQGHAENRAREAAEREKAADRKLQEAEQAIQARFAEQQATVQQLGQFAQVLQHELNGEIQQQPWDQLWEQNPAQARKLERYYSDRQSRVNGIMQNIAQRDAHARQQAEQARESAASKAKEQQLRRLMDFVPEWRDNAVREKEAQEITQWAIGRDYDPRFLNALSDGLVPNAAAIVRDLRSSWQHDTLQKSKPAIEAKVRAAPKLIKPGQAPTQESGKAAKLRGLKQNIKNASPADSSKAFEAFLLGAGLA